jgi:peptidoglycan hydrolase CwlO-like protein
MIFANILDFDSNLTAAIISAVFGGAGLKIIEKMLGKNDEAFKEAASIRQELRQQIEDLRKEVDALREKVTAAEQEADEWREKYWHQVQLIASLKADHPRPTE